MNPWLPILSASFVCTFQRTWIEATDRLYPAILAFQYSGKRGDIYNILWALVFGFATLNILSLVARRFEPNRSRLSFGEMLAIMTVVVSVCLLTWEMLYLFRVLPFKLHPF
jgi:hypothetical protein